MSIRVFENSFSQEVFDLGFQSIRRVVAHGSGGSILLTHVPNDFGYSRHPADMVDRALRVYAGFLSGQAERQASIVLPIGNAPLKPRDGRGLCLDLTGKQIQILEELSPVDADGNIRLDEMQSRVLRTFLYNKPEDTRQIAAGLATGAEQWNREQEEKARAEAVRHEAEARTKAQVKANMALIQPGLDALSKLPGSKFSFRCTDQESRIIIDTSVSYLEYRDPDEARYSSYPRAMSRSAYAAVRKANLYVEASGVSGYGFSSSEKLSSELKSPADASQFMGQLAKILAQRGIVAPDSTLEPAKSIASIVPTPGPLRVGEKVYRDGVCTGIYLGIWEPKDRDGQSLGQKFNVFAAPEDLTDERGGRTLLTFQDTAKHLTTKKNWHGYDGGDYASDTALYPALRGGSYKGEWLIPTFDLLAGVKEVFGDIVQPDNLYAHKDTGDFKGTFVTSGKGSDSRKGVNTNHPGVYWSLAEFPGIPRFVWCARFATGVNGIFPKDELRASCRPVRVELVI